MGDCNEIKFKEYKMSLPEGYSRRLVGPNLFFIESGTVLDIPLEHDKQKLVELWQAEAERILPELRFDVIKLDYKIYNNGIRLALVAPFDITMASCDVIDFIWASACQIFEEGAAKSIDEAKNMLIPIIESEENLKLREIHKLALSKGLNIFYDEGLVTIGSGKKSFQFNVDDLDINQIPWATISDIPIVLVTGTNGKTTTVRMTSFICQESKKVVGYCSTDWVMIDGKIVDRGDFSGPTGNKFVLTNPDVDVAVLEVARGGLLKRGLANTHVTAAAVTNISPDHLGEDGVETLADLAEAKGIVYSAVESKGHAVINLDDPNMLARISQIKGEKVFVSQKLSEDELQPYIDGADYVCFVKNSAFYFKSKNIEHKIAELKDVPITVNGFAKHNVENTLVAICLSYELGCDLDQISNALKIYQNSDKENLGRANVFKVQGATVILDFAHNAAGIKAIFEMAQGYEGKEITILFGQTGDRKFSIHDMCEIIEQYKPKQVLVKDTEIYLRGAEKGEVPALIESSLLLHGYPKANIKHFAIENDAVDYALDNLKSSETYILCCHEKVEEVIEKIKSKA
ncbi:MAG: cyanophycin synthetase [Francisellaceae bacterium]|jgi:cyanophycin synthetase